MALTKSHGYDLVSQKSPRSWTAAELHKPLFLTNPDVSVRGLNRMTAIVTGGGGAIGRAICRRFADEGVVVGVFDMNGTSAAETVELIHRGGGHAHSFVADIADYEAVKQGAAAFERVAGPTEILVNNAGWDRFANFLDSDVELWDRLIAVNFRGPLNLHHIVVRGMAERRRGKVINIASDAGRVGSSGEAVYAGCKGGLIAFTKSLARELASRGVNLNVVCPGPTDTPLFRDFAGEGEAGQKVAAALERAIPMKRLGRPEDLPGLVAFLSSEDASFITGQVISVSGGLTMHG
jgi:2-hydroxycyclohexanecarboxyl-CoA dehydrogenase